VSPKHANWIVNLGSASADDVLRVMATVRRRVYDKFGIWLQTEVRLVGRDHSIVAALSTIDDELRTRH